MQKCLSASPESQVDVVERKLGAYIRANGHAVGAALPKEQELARRFGVGRSAVREALSRLHMLGIVNSRKRRGMRISRPDCFAGLDRLVSMGILRRSDEEDLLELRMIVELGMADLIYVRKTRGDIKELEAILDRFSKPSGRRSLKDEVAENIAFHQRLYAIARNAAVARLQHILQPVFSIIAKERSAFPSRMALTHRQVLAALNHGPAAAFRDAMRRHLVMYYRHAQRRPGRILPGEPLGGGGG